MMNWAGCKKPERLPGPKGCKWGVEKEIKVKQGQSDLKIIESETSPAEVHEPAALLNSASAKEGTKWGRRDWFRAQIDAVTHSTCWSCLGSRRAQGPELGTQKMVCFARDPAKAEEPGRKRGKDPLAGKRTC